MDNTFTPEQSLRLIDETIREAKHSHMKVNFYFLLWGVLFALAGIAAYVLAISGWEYNWVVWPLTGIIGGIISGVHGSREGRKQQVSTMMDRVHQWLWTAYLITLLLLIVGLVTSRVDPNPFVLLLTGLPTFLSGLLMRFKPLVYGGVLFWVIGTLSLFFLREYSPLVYSFGLIVGYIIPGIMLKKQEDGIRTA
jgi:uncharacterized membrane protein HdeD (DUF308 family)